MSPGNSVEQSDNEDDMIMLSIQKAFQQFDSEGVGAISVTDLPALVNVLQEPLTLNEIKDMTRNLDITNTGMVGFQEFHQFWVNSN
jgi:Ca2+-binding EF-hand superfamily protein|tara:strand:- start:309 stop:566 length:258 start_codon:yes stop_codon:yes gene_type:complete